jgi:hypothetical protein
MIPDQPSARFRFPLRRSPAHILATVAPSTSSLPEVTRRTSTSLLGGETPALGRDGPVALAGVDPVTAAVGRPPGSAPGDRLRAVDRPSFAMVTD